MIRKIVLGLFAVTVATGGLALAQQSAIKRTPLQKVEYPDGHVTLTALVEIAPGGAAGRHTHPGIEVSYIMEGEADLIVAKHRNGPTDTVTVAFQGHFSRFTDMAPGDFG